MSNAKDLAWFELQAAPYDLRLAIVPGQPVFFGQDRKGKGPEAWLLRPSEHPETVRAITQGIAQLLNTHQILQLSPRSPARAFDPEALKKPSLHLRMVWQDGSRWSGYYPHNAIPDNVMRFTLDCRALGMYHIAAKPARTLTSREARSEIRPQSRVQAHKVHGIQFVSEQDGEAEQDLKGALGQQFAGNHLVQSAYLARVQYVNSAELHVALCLRLKSAPRPGVVKDISQCFSSRFGPETHLDILMLSDDQERLLQGVCRPFFTTYA